MSEIRWNGYGYTNTMKRSEIGGKNNNSSTLSEGAKKATNMTVLSTSPSSAAGHILDQTCTNAQKT